jgi:general secretion pathway protein D
VQKYQKITKYFVKYCLNLTLILSFFSCAQGRIDPYFDDVGMTEQDIKDSVIKSKTDSKKSANPAEKKDAQPPKLLQGIMSQPLPRIGGEKIISFYVTDQVPLRDVLIELGRVAQIDVDVDPKISGGVIINAKNRPLKEIIDRIATQGNLRYSYKNKVLYFESDQPYMKNYFVDYLLDSELWSEVQTNIQNIFTSNQSSSSTEVSSSAISSSSITPNKSAGMLTIFATAKQHEAVEKYLQDVYRQSSTQVLIEAKVIEVALSDKFRAGIDWTQDGFKFSPLAAGSDYTSTISVSNPAVKIFGGDIGLVVEAMSQFGSTKAISSPRIHAVNNQKASLNFAEKLVYFKVEAQQSIQGGGTTVNGLSGTTVARSVTSTKVEENVGVQIEITPSINIKTGEITMNISPKITQKTGSVDDPATADKTQFSFQNSVPIITTREVNTKVKIASGNVVVIGGLMKNSADAKESGIPFLRRIPILGWLFKSFYKTTDVSETVILIKATIVNSGSKTSKIDKEMQEKYDVNRRIYFEK